MRLSRIFVDTDLDLDTKIDLVVDRAHYVKNVLRLKNGDNILLFNGRTTLDYLGEISIQGRQVSASIVSAQQKDNESPTDITLVQAAGKSDHMDFIVQKGTELGISRFTFFNSQRTQSPLKGKRQQKRLSHWQRIAISACEQCNRNSIPAISFAVDLATFIQNDARGNRLLLDFNGEHCHQLTQQLDPGANFQLLVGCEGGLTNGEIQLAKAHGYLSCQFGPRVLRMETAAISIISVIQHQFGDM